MTEMQIHYGGQDFDTYIAGNTDIITDSDGKGRVYFEGKLLTGGSKVVNDFYLKSKRKAA